MKTWYVGRRGGAADARAGDPLAGRGVGAALPGGGERRFRAAVPGAVAAEEGLGVAAAAEAVGTTAETLRQWIKRGVAEGLDALDARKPGSGARPKLSAAQQEQVLAWADADPRATIPGLRRRVAAAWRIALSETQVWALVRGRGFRRVVPRKRHYQADTAALVTAE
ncbi:MAG: hypothetical protein AVDCRST_MAG88-4208 [uncultured Thermomicrobiales bacterium]|uniref:Winged helix-turn helix domain-containing protein n=1 Tax=uncultured Thermomicrobiales bacterium TaxID=1645740 RepID=A0A6J4VSB6_9BACT|nr:MAG: hypothetical protein AVDCRST_MAG88-4208 [uncultured Thermomicrobiales bacterium]